MHRAPAWAVSGADIHTRSFARSTATKRKECLSLICTKVLDSPVMTHSSNHLEDLDRRCKFEFPAVPTTHDYPLASPCFSADIWVYNCWTTSKGNNTFVYSTKQHKLTSTLQRQIAQLLIPTHTLSSQASHSDRPGSCLTLGTLWGLSVNFLIWKIRLILPTL